MIKKDPMLPPEYDTRMVEWNLKHEIISKDGLDKFLKSLPDDGANCELLHIQDEDVELS